jgi:hypothetical protein
MPGTMRQADPARSAHQHGFPAGINEARCIATMRGAALACVRAAGWKWLELP